MPNIKPVSVLRNDIKKRAQRSDDYCARFSMPGVWLRYLGISYSGKELKYFQILRHP
jgi:hypothetical protein